MPIIPLWFAAVFVPLIASQCIRLMQVDPVAWLLADYAGRLGALVLLQIHPQARAVAFATTSRRTGWVETLAWIVGLVLLYRLAHTWIKPIVDAAIPETRIGAYPDIRGVLRLFDTSFGLALVAVSEEIIFRRCARDVLRRRLGDGWAMVVFSALLFAAYHWWTGLGNIAAAFLFGVAAMLMFRRCAALWPVVAAHYLIDFDMFG